MEHVETTQSETSEFKTDTTTNLTFFKGSVRLKHEILYSPCVEHVETTQSETSESKTDREPEMLLAI